MDTNIIALPTKMPMKKSGDLNRIGHVYRKAFRKYSSKLNRMNPQFLALIDVDTRVSNTYFETLLSFLNTWNMIGCACGQASSNERSWQPMGSGKVCRWEIVKAIDLETAWDLDWDSLLNVYSETLGYRNAILEDIEVDTPPSAGFTIRGLYRRGRVLFYKGMPFWLFLSKLLRAYLIKGKWKAAKALLLGYATEFIKRSWRCPNKVIRDYYGAKGWWRRKLKPDEALRISFGNGEF